MSRRVTASALPLLAHCPGQAVLEHFPSTSPEATSGQRLHEELVPALVAGQLPDTPRGRALADVAVAEGARAEVAYAVDFERMTSRELAPAHPRDYSGATEHEMPGTVDWAAPRERGELKTGAVRVDGPRYNRQMWHGASAAWYSAGELVEMVLVHARPPDRAGRSRGYIARYTPTISDLGQWREKILRSLDVVRSAREAQSAGNRLPLVLGDHCGICDARLVCPAIAETVGHDNPADRVIVARSRRLAVARELDLAERLLEGDVTAEDGRILRPRTSYRRKLDTAKALAALPGLAAYTHPLLTTGGLDDYARTRTDLGQTVKARKSEVARQLEQAGALEYTDSTRHEET